MLFTLYLDTTISEPLSFDTPLGEVLTPLASTCYTGIELLTLLLAELLHILFCGCVALRHLRECLAKAAVPLVRILAEETCNALQQCVSGPLRFNAFCLK